LDEAPCNFVATGPHFRGVYGPHHPELNALMVEAASTSKTSVNFYKATERFIPEDGRL
jgi:hypothetical protein